MKEEMKNTVERHILVVLPHPDDEVFGLAGTLAMHIEQGTQVTYACLTLGEMARNMGNPPFTNRIGLPRIREQELALSCRAIGIQDLRMLGFHDKTIEFEEQALLDEPIRALVEEIKPSLVITFYPGYAVHPDHDACGAAVVRVIASLPKEQRPPVHCMAFSRDHEEAIGKPDVIHDVRRYLQQKLAAIEAHRSQFHASDMIGTSKFTIEALEERVGIERFWTYKFH